LEEKPQIKELASNPLLLTMLCLTFDERMEFPPNRAELYGEAIDATEGTLEGLVRDYMANDKWREVFLITTEMLDKANNFILQMKQRIDDELVNNEDLCTLLTQIQTQVIKKDSPYSLSVSMSLGIFYILR